MSSTIRAGNSSHRLSALSCHTWSIHVHFNIRRPDKQGNTTVTRVTFQQLGRKSSFLVQNSIQTQSLVTCTHLNSLVCVDNPSLIHAQEKTCSHKHPCRQRTQNKSHTKMNVNAVSARKEDASTYLCITVCFPMSCHIIPLVSLKFLWRKTIKGSLKTPERETVTPSVSGQPAHYAKAPILHGLTNQGAFRFLFQLTTAPKNWT